MTGIHNHYWCFLPNIYESAPETDEINIIFVDQDGYNTHSDCAGCKNHNQTPLLFVSGSSGAATKATVEEYTLENLSKLSITDSDKKFIAGNQSRMNLGKASKMGRKLEYWKGPSYDYVEGQDHPNKDHKTFQGGPIDIPAPAKRSGLYNPLNYGNLFSWLYYKHHEGIYCGLPDGRTYDNEPGSDLSKLENWDRGNIAYGKQRLYYKDMYEEEEGDSGITFGRGLVNARPHTLILQLDPRNIWNTHRTTMNLHDNASRMYGEYPNKKTYYNGMGGVVGGTDTLSPITYAYANRSDYQKEAGTNFLPCCSRTDGSMSSTCPYPVHDKNFNFQEPRDRYNMLNNYIPGRASFTGTVTISRSGLLPRSLDELGSGDDIMEAEGPYHTSPPPYKQDDKFAAPIMSDVWSEQQDSGLGTPDSPRAYTEKEFLESTFDADAFPDLSRWTWFRHEWGGTNYPHELYDEWSPGIQGASDNQGQGFFGERGHYNAMRLPKGLMAAYEEYDNDTAQWGSQTGIVYGYTITTRPTDNDYYYNSTRIEYDPGGTKYNAGATDLMDIPIYGFRFAELPENGCRGWWCEGSPMYNLWGAWFGTQGSTAPGIIGSRSVAPEDISGLPDGGGFDSDKWEGLLDKTGLVYYDGYDVLDGSMPVWKRMMSPHGFTSDAYVVGRTKFKHEIDLFERHPSDSQSFDNIGAWIGGETPPEWDWGADTPPWFDLGDWGPDATGLCFAFGDALYDENGNNINGGDPDDISVGSCCWTDTRPDSEYFGKQFCFDPWFLSLGTPFNESWSGFYTAQGFYESFNRRIFFAKATCDCIGLRDNVETSWHPHTTCMLNDGSIDDAFPTYYRHYLGMDVSLFINQTFNNPYSLWGIINPDDPNDNIEDLYNPSPCGGQYRVWPCNERGPRWWPQYLFNHYPGVAPSLVWALEGGTTSVNVPVGANTWPDYRQRALWSNWDSVIGLDELYDDATMHCLKVPDGYGQPGGPQPGETGPYWIEVSAGDFPWKECDWPWSRHTYDAHDFPGECATGGVLGFYPTSPADQRQMLAGVGEDPYGNRRVLLKAIDSRCEGFLSWYDDRKPSPHDGPGNRPSWVDWYPGRYINPGEDAWYSAAGPGGEAVHARPTPPGTGLGNYGPHPSVNAGRLSDVGFESTPPRRIRFSTWARWREWVPWTNFAPVIMNHIERWIMPGRVKNLKKVTIHLPKGVHAFGRGEHSEWGEFTPTTGDLYFPKSVTDYIFPLRGLNHGCRPEFVGGTGATAEPEFYTDHVPGHLLPQSSYGPNFPYGFDLSGTRKSLNAILRNINEDIEIEWVLYPEKDIGSMYFNNGIYAFNFGTAQNNAGIFLGEIIYQTCAYNYYENDFGDKIWYDTQKECLDFLDPTRVCTDYYDYEFPNGFARYYTDPQGTLDDVPNMGQDYWNRDSNGRYDYYTWLGTEDTPTKKGWRGIEFYQKLMRVGDDRYRQDYVHDDLLGWLRGFDIWNDSNETTLDTPVMRLYHLFMNSGISALNAINGYQIATEPCRYSGYRPNTYVLYETLEKLHPDLFTAAYDLDPYLRPLKTFNTQKHLVGYYDIINKDTEYGNNHIIEKYIEATGPPPSDIRYPGSSKGGASAGTDGDMCWGPRCRPPQGAYTGMVTTDVESDLGGGFLGHRDWGWGNAGGGETGTAGPIETDDKYETLTLADVVDWYLNAGWYNDNGARDDALAALASDGWHPDQIVWANACPTIGGQLGGNFGGWSCEGGWTDWDVGCGWQGEPTTCEDPTTTNCCGLGLWHYDPEDPQAVCGRGPNEEDRLCVDLIHAGPDLSGGYDIINRFPNFWDTLSYSCNSFGTGIMQWAYMKSRSVVPFDDLWWKQFMLPVLEIIWYFFNLDDPGSPWLHSNGGCFDFEPGDFWESYVNNFSGDAQDWKAQPNYFNAVNKCWSNRDIYNMVAGGLICRPENWNLVPQTNSTLWSPNRAEMVRTMYGINIEEAMPDVMYKDQIQLRSYHGRQTLPRLLEAVTLRDKGGDHRYGFGYLDLDCEDYNCADLDEELSGLYGPAYNINPEEVDGEVIWDTILDFEAERDLDMCGPVDSPHPCIMRFVRPNTDITLTDRYGYTMEGYHPLQTSKNGVGKPIEMGSDFSGDGILPSHGHGNTFDIRFAYRVPPAGDEYDNFDELSTRTQIIHHTGKQVKGVDLGNQTGYQGDDGNYLT